MLHLIKLCVGCDSLQDLERWQKQRLKEKKAKGQKPELVHVTRQTPKRDAELLDGGSLYWVIKGVVRCRQPILRLAAAIDENGMSCCDIIMAPDMVRTLPRPKSAFQGWRYIEPKDAPPDLAKSGFDKDADPKIAEELMRLGLI